VICSPPDAVPLRFGENSFFPHLGAAEACGIRPTVVHLPGLALDIDNPEDLAKFARLGSHTRTGALLADGAMVRSGKASGVIARNAETKRSRSG
jgi:2-phospho-L-lactate guanylyltransferase